MSVKQINAIAFLLCSLALSACDEIPKTLDLSVSAAEGNDVTSILSGCNEGFHDGYLFCRMKEGADQTAIIRLHLPKLNCDRDDCVVFQFLRLDGSYGYRGGIPKGKTDAEIPLSKITGSEQGISMNEDGEYGINVAVYFKDADGVERSFRSDGLIRVKVLGAKYQRLGCNDPMTGWDRSLSKQCRAEYSTASRSALCGSCGRGSKVE